jgi:hypothetical protein
MITVACHKEHAELDSISHQISSVHQVSGVLGDIPESKLSYYAMDIHYIAELVNRAALYQTAGVPFIFYSTNIPL